MRQSNNKVLELQFWRK